MYFHNIWPGGGKKQIINVNSTDRKMRTLWSLLMEFCLSELKCLVINTVTLCIVMILDSEEDQVMDEGREMWNTNIVYVAEWNSAFQQYRRCFLNAFFPEMLFFNLNCTLIYSWCPLDNSPPLTLNRRPVIIWTNDGLVYGHIMHHTAKMSQYFSS